MFVSVLRVIGLSGLVLFGMTACDRPKSPPPATAATNATVPAPAAAGAGALTNTGEFSTIHWLGKKQIARDTNAATVMAIWNLPETAALGAQTLDKLALAPWRLLKGDAATNGAPTAQLRPLLADLVTEEFQLTFHHSTNAPAAWSLAVKLPADRVPVWQTNLVAVLESLTGARAQSSAEGFALTVAPSNHVAFHPRVARAWTVLWVESAPSSPAARTAALDALSAELATLNATASPWLTLSLDPAALNRHFAFDLPLPTNVPRVTLAVDGVNHQVSSRGHLVFAQPLKLRLEPWNVPTNLLSEPLVSFTAVRGLGPRLAALPELQRLGITNPPNQCYQWGLGNAPFFTYLAAPSPDASNQVAQITERLVNNIAPRLPELGVMGSIDKVAGGNGVAWTGIPYIGPRLTSISQPGGDFIRLGFFPPPGASRPAPAELLYSLTARSNLLAYDWELTGTRVDGLTGLIQILRFSSGHARISPYTASMSWLRAAKTNLANTSTGVMLDSPAALSFSRTSTIGLSALELQLLVDWLESPAFPRGLHTSLAQKDLNFVLPATTP